MEDSKKERSLNLKPLFICSLLAVFAGSIFFVAHQVNKSRKEALWREFEQKFAQVLKGDSSVKVIKLLGPPSRVKKPPLMNQRTSIYDSQNSTGHDFDAITGATIGLNAKDIYFELWHYDIAARTFSFLFKPVTPSSLDLVLYLKYPSGEIPGQISFK